MNQLRGYPPCTFDLPVGRPEYNSLAQLNRDILVEINGSGDD